MTVTIAGLWGSVVYSTNQLTNAIIVRVPFTTEDPGLRTNIAAGLVTALNLASNSIATNATALANFLSKGASPAQTVIGPVRFNSISGTNSGLTNGIISAATLVNPVATNFVNYGNALRSEGSGGNSFQVGSNALAIGNLSLAVGNSAVANGLRSTAVGVGASATNGDNVAIGTSAKAHTNFSVSIGSSANAYGAYDIAIGYIETVSGPWAIGIGFNGNATHEGGIQI